MVRRVLLLMVLSLVVPASAQAATVTLSDGVLRFTAAPGLTNNITFRESGGTVTVTREFGAQDADPFVRAMEGSRTNVLVPEKGKPFAL